MVKLLVLSSLSITFLKYSFLSLIWETYQTSIRQKWFLKESVASKLWSGWNAATYTVLGLKGCLQ